MSPQPFIALSYLSSELCAIAGGPPKPKTKDVSCNHHVDS
jgi:hypothetical protein